MKKIIILAISILVGGLIISVSLYKIQTIKKESIEKQQKQQIQLKEEKDKIKEKETKDSNFQKKITCTELQNQLIKNITNYNSSQKSYIDDNCVGCDIKTHSYHLYIHNKEFKEIFYSSNINSCIYVVSDKTLIKNDPNSNPNIGKWDVSFDSYFIIDALTNETVDIVQIIHRGEQFNSIQQADEIIKKYK